MEEDLKILKNLITTKFNLDYSIDSSDKEAIEHLVQAYKQSEKIIDRVIDYIMIHQQVKTMRKIFCKHCKIQSGCTYSGIHRDCIRRYSEYVAKQESINEMHNDLELLEGDE